MGIIYRTKLIHRFVFEQNIDTFREMPEEDWRLTEASTVLYFLFPNVQFNVAPGGDLFLIKNLPHPTEVGRSITKVGVYFSKETIAQAKVAEEEGRLAGAGQAVTEYHRRWKLLWNFSPESFKTKII